MKKLPTKPAVTEPTPWKLSSHNDKSGRTYVIAYRNRWIPELKQARRAATRHVGRLQPDGQILFSDAWLKDHPEYAKGEWFYECNTIITRSASERVDALKESGLDYRQDAVQVGLTLGVWKLAINRSVLADLQTVFGEKDACTLLQLGIYQLDEPGAMMNYETWLPMVYLPGAKLLSSQRISECLATVTQEKMDKFFKLRHDRHTLEKDGEGTPSVLALDSTSLSTYSNTIRDADYGHAKQNPELKQVNLTFACDYASGEALYAYECDGSFNDVASLPEILYRMAEREFDLSRTILVTDRGYCSMHNIQRQLDLGLQFIQGYTLSDGSLKRAFKKHRQVLRDHAFYSTEYSVSAVTIKEKWTQSTDAGNLTIDTYVHLYFDPQLELDQRNNFLTGLDAVVKTKNEGRKVDYDQWKRFASFVSEKEVTTKQKTKKTLYQRDDVAVRHALEFMGCYALRSNAVSDPFAALELYRRRNIVEQAFNQYKNQTEGSRLFSTQSTYLGRIFVHIIAQSLRMMLYMNAKKASQVNPKLSLPEQSLTKALRYLRGIMATRPLGSNHWILRQLTKKQRDLLSLLLLDLEASKHRLLS